VAGSKRVCLSPTGDLKQLQLPAIWEEFHHHHHHHHQEQQQQHGSTSSNVSVVLVVSVTVITENLWTEISVKCSERRQPTRQRTDSLFIPTHSAPAVLHPDNCCWFWNVGGMFFLSCGRIWTKTCCGRIATVTRKWQVTFVKYLEVVQDSGLAELDVVERYWWSADCCFSFF